MTLAHELEVACGAARAAGDLLRERFGSRLEIRYKGPTDLATEMDVRSERLLRELLGAAFPEYGFAGEELGGKCGPGAPCWLVDPLDGTTNYAHGYPIFAVSVALERDGQVVLGVVYHPTRDELFAATRSGGATLNGRPIAVSEIADLSRSLLGSGFPYYAWHRDDDNCRQWRSLLKRVTSLRADGSAALDFCHVAAGRLDGFWELDLEAHDMAAGALIVKEAGGAVTSMDGRPLDIRGRGVVASNGRLHDDLVKALQASS